MLLAIALLALGLSAASASATGLLSLNANGMALEPGAPFLASSGSLTLGFGTRRKPLSISCTKNMLVGTIETNVKPKDTVSLFESSFSGGNPMNEALCSSSVNFETTATFGTLTLLPTGKAELRMPAFELVPPPPHNTSFGTCRFSNSAIHGTFPVSASEPGTPIAITFNAQLRIVANSGHECGTGASLATSLEVTSGGSPVIGLVVP
jgi:hypothetical protein